MTDWRVTRYTLDLWCLRADFEGKPSEEYMDGNEVRTFYSADQAIAFLNGLRFDDLMIRANKARFEDVPGTPTAVLIYELCEFMEAQRRELIPKRACLCLTRHQDPLEARQPDLAEAHQPPSSDSRN